MNRIFKKIAAAVTAVCMCAAMAVNVQISADAYNVGDINRDGKVSMLDLTAINKYLTGMIEIADYSLADVTGNCAINFVDAKVLQSFLLSMIDNLPYTVIDEQPQNQEAE